MKTPHTENASSPKLNTDPEKHPPIGLIHIKVVKRHTEPVYAGGGKTFGQIVDQVIDDSRESGEEMLSITVDFSRD